MAMNPILQTLRMKNVVVDDLEEMLGQLTGDEKRLWASWQIDSVVSDKKELDGNLNFGGSYED
jgi:hypothetical protein